MSLKSSWPLGGLLIKILNLHSRRDVSFIVKKISEELERADAHPYGARPFQRKDYINKFLTLTNKILSKKESDRFLKNVQNLKNLKSGQLDKLNLMVKKSKLKRNLKKGIF